MKSNTGTIHFSRMQNMKCQSTIFKWYWYGALKQSVQGRERNSSLKSSCIFKQKIQRAVPRFLAWLNAEWAAEKPAAASWLPLPPPDVPVMFTFQLCTHSRPAIMI